MRAQLYDPRNGSNLPQSFPNVFYSERLSIFSAGHKTFLSFHGFAFAEWIICGPPSIGHLEGVYHDRETLSGVSVWAENRRLLGHG